MNAPRKPAPATLTFRQIMEALQTREVERAKWMVRAITLLQMVENTDIPREVLAKQCKQCAEEAPQ